ncbi:MAG: peptidoglycan-binding domain-containing protein, partial [Gammaproteobacteria bacterium]
HHHLSKSQIEQVQKALDHHGYKVTADGKWGEQTRHAIEQFQKKDHLKVTGTPDKKTREALGLHW